MYPRHREFWWESATRLALAWWCRLLIYPSENQWRRSSWHHFGGVACCEHYYVILTFISRRLADEMLCPLRSVSMNVYRSSLRDREVHSSLRGINHSLGRDNSQSCPTPILCAITSRPLSSKNRIILGTFNTRDLHFWPSSVCQILPATTKETPRCILTNLAHKEKEERLDEQLERRGNMSEEESSCMDKEHTDLMSDAVSGIYHRETYMRLSSPGKVWGSEKGNASRCRTSVVSV